MRKIAMAVAVCLLWTDGALSQQERAATAPATTQPATLQQRKDQERRAIEERGRDTLGIGPFTAEQVVRLSVNEGRITAVTSIPPDLGDRRVQVSDDRGYWRAVVQGDPNGNDLPIYFMIEKYDFLDPKAIYSHAQVLGSSTQVQIVGDWEYENGSLHVALLDRAGMVDPDEGIVEAGGVTLFVNGFDSEGGRNVNVRVRATDLRSLRRQHPREVSAYLRPVLRELHADALVAVDEKLAWQVLGTGKKLDPKVIEQVNALLPKLDADDFNERQDAARALRELGVEGALALLQMDRQKLTPEQNARVEEVIALYHQAATKDTSKLAEDTEFLLDVLLTEEPELRRIALDRLNKTLGQPIDIEIDGSARQRSDRVAELRAELLPPPATQAVEPQ